jgi:lanosterol synthase
MSNEKQSTRIGGWRTPANGHLTVDANGDTKTDYSRWRLTDVEARHTWMYLEDDEANEKQPQSIAEKYHLGLPTVFSARFFCKTTFN